MRLQITIEGDALDRLRRSAEADMRPLGWQAKALLLAALGAVSSPDQGNTGGSIEKPSVVAARTREEVRDGRAVA